jgi:hypothetical protein
LRLTIYRYIKESRTQRKRNKTQTGIKKIEETKLNDINETMFQGTDLTFYRLLVNKIDVSQAKRHLSSIYAHTCGLL